MNETSGTKLPSSWTRARLETVAEIHDELRCPVNASERELRPGTVPYYGATGQVGWIDDHLLDGEYVLLGEDGAPFLDATKSKAYIISGKSWVNNHAHVLRAVDGISTNRYLLYALNATDYRDAVNGTTRLKLTQSAMRELTLSLPPLAEQRRIVAAIEEQFTRLDAGVAALKRAQAALKRYRAAVLKAAVEGKLTASWRSQHPDVRPARELLADILAERRARWEADLRAKGKDPAKYDEPQSPQSEGLPELPQGWVWATVEQVGEVQLGRQRAPQYHTGEHMRPYLRVANVFEDRIDVSDVLEMNFTPSEYETYQLKFGDILLNEGQSLELIGRPAMYRDEVPGACFQNTLVRFRARAGLPAGYALVVFLAYLHSQRFQRIGKHTTNIAHLGARRFAELEFPLPSPTEMERIVAEVEQRLSVVSALEATIAANLKRAERLRQAILERAFTGRLAPQDPADEPARALLERVRREREAATNEHTRNVLPDGQPAAVRASQKPLWE